MATFTLTITPGVTTAQVYGLLTGGDPLYEDYRCIDLYIDGTPYSEIWSNEQGGASNTFSDTLQGLDPSTTYSYQATLCYRDTPNGPWIPSSLVESGTFTTQAAPPISINSFTVTQQAAGSNTADFHFTLSRAGSFYVIAEGGTLIDQDSISSANVSGSITLPFGTHTLTLWVQASDSTTDTATVTVTMRAATGPYIYCTKDGVEDWYPATPYIYDGNDWVPATAYIYTSGGWEPQ